MSSARTGSHGGAGEVEEEGGRAESMCKAAAVMSILVVGSALVVVAAGFGERREMSRAEQAREASGMATGARCAVVYMRGRWWVEKVKARHGCKRQPRQHSAMLVPR